MGPWFAWITTACGSCLTRSSYYIDCDSVAIGHQVIADTR